MATGYSRDASGFSPTPATTSLHHGDRSNLKNSLSSTFGRMRVSPKDSADDVFIAPPHSSTPFQQQGPQTQSVGSRRSSVLSATTTSTEYLKLEHFKKGQELGKGNCGAVYTAAVKDPTNAPTLLPALVIKEQVPAEDESVGDFLTEVKKETGIQRKAGSVIHIYDEQFDPVTNQYSILMDHAGTVLIDLQNKYEGCYFPEDVVLNFTRQLFQQLQTMHENGVAHLDIKPDNLLVNGQGRIAVSDFGLAQEKVKSGKNRQFSGMHGTPIYMAPAMFKKDRLYSEKTDIWSAGLTIAVMLTGLMPDFVESFSEFDHVFDKAKFAKYLKRITIHKNVSNEWAVFLAKLLSMHDQQRPSAKSALELPPLKKSSCSSLESSLGSDSRLNNSFERMRKLREARESFSEEDGSCVVDGQQLTRFELLESIDKLERELRPEQVLKEKEVLQSDLNALGKREERLQSEFQRTAVINRSKRFKLKSEIEQVKADKQRVADELDAIH